MKVALVAIGRLENRYAIEFVNYYKQIGFDHIFIIDNNYGDEEHFEDVLQSYINDQYVSIIDYRDKCGEGWNKSIQVISYINTYDNIKDDYDWIFFCDFDEFLTFRKDKNIKDYLSRECFKDANQILINWKIYTDNDLIYDDNRSCLERFTQPMSTYKHIEYDYPENKHVKPIIKGGLNNLVMYTPHNFYNDILRFTTYNNNGYHYDEINIINGVIDINYNLSYVKHFTTKTIDEWVNNKCKRGTADRKKTDFNSTYPFLRFFKYNKVTPEKLNYLKAHGYDIDNINKKSIKNFSVWCDNDYINKINSKK